MKHSNNIIHKARSLTMSNNTIAMLNGVDTMNSIAMEREALKQSAIVIEQGNKALEAILHPIPHKALVNDLPPVTSKTETVKGTTAVVVETGELLTLDDVRHSLILGAGVTLDGKALPWSAYIELITSHVDKEKKITEKGALKTDIETFCADGISAYEFEKVHGLYRRMKSYYMGKKKGSQKNSKSWKTEFEALAQRVFDMTYDVMNTKGDTRALFTALNTTVKDLHNVAREALASASPE